VTRGAVSLAAIVALALAATAAPTGAASERAAEDRFRALVFSRTEGFRHDSIAAGIEAIRDLGRDARFAVKAAERASAFRPRKLGRYEVVVFLSTTGDVLDPRGQAALRAFIRRGGGFVGVHAAADTEYDWPYYGGLVGAYFQSHPEVQQASLDVADREHPATRDLPLRWTRTDEWYDFRTNPRGAVHVLATLDETTYTGGSMGADHPIAWCQRYRGGRSLYTAGGHTSESFAEPDFRQHLLGAIRWAAGERSGGCSPN
jgi:type 1 glutamine amidotransferase